MATDTQTNVVQLSTGKYRVQEPGLDGWQSLLDVLEDSDVDTIVDLLQSRDLFAEDSKGEKPDRAKQAKLLLPILRKAPKAVKAFVAGCLYRVDGGAAVQPSEAGKLTLSDLAVFATAAQGANVFRGLSDLVGNLQALAGPRLATEPAATGAKAGGKPHEPK